VDLYRRLIPQIAEQDQKSGAQGYVLHWNDPDAVWNKVDDIRAVWNAIGLSPVIQTLFWVLETMEGEELALLESLDTLTDPFEAPEDMLPIIARSFGYSLKDGLDEATKRVVVQGLFHAYKSLGQRVGFDVFYRMVGFKIIRVLPLWKKDINEDLNRYSQQRYDTVDVVAEPVGPAGNLAYKTTLGDPPIVPGSLRITDGSVVLKDQPEGFGSDGLVATPSAPLVGPNGETGSINYYTGELEVNFVVAAGGAVTANYAQITDEYPYRAARMDIEILMNPGGAPIPLVDTEVTRSILDRLDEARPIHVLLRSLTLAFDVQDTVQPGATDAVGCTTSLRDVRDPFGALPGQHSLYFIDESPNVDQDNLHITHASGGTAMRDLVLEDRIDGMVCPGMDLLDIDAGVYSQKA
jgi:hypothetical protein